MFFAVKYKNKKLRSKSFFFIWVGTLDPRVVLSIRKVDALVK